MEIISRDEIEAIEERLKQAMLDSDIDALNQIIAEDLIFINHLGMPMSKQDDLDAHKSGFIKINRIENQDMKIKCEKDTAVVSVLSRIDGEFAGEKSEIQLRFMRVWKHTGDHSFVLIAAQSTMAS